MDILQLLDIVATEIIEDSSSYHIKAKILADLTFCNKCYEDVLVRNGFRVIMYRDTPMHGKTVGIYLSFQRYLCKNCRATHYQTAESIDINHLMTKRLVKYINQRAYQEMFTSMATEIGVDEKTIRNVFANNVEGQLRQQHMETPVVLGIDEVHLLHHPRCVITNIEQSTIIDILENRNKSMLLKYFGQMQDKSHVKIVTMDMWRPYHDVIRTTIPHAQIVIDKFHIVRMASDAMEKVRRNMRNTLTHKQQLQLKNDRLILLQRNFQLTPEEKFTLECWTGQFPLLGQAYQIKEGFYNIWSNRSRADAEQAYDTWFKRIPMELIDFFIPIINTVDNWYEPIFNYFTNRYTNATTEALNGLIKMMHRNGRGYSFEVLRSRILLAHGTHKIEKSRKFNRVGNDKFLTSDLPERDKNYGVSIQKLIEIFELENVPSTK